MSSTSPAAEPLNTRRLTWLYIVALSLVAVLTSLGHLLVHQVLVRLEGDAGVVNIAGRQRMLSQRIPRVMLTLAAHQSSDDREADVKELRSLLRQWNGAHRKLAGKTAARIEPPASVAGSESDEESRLNSDSVHALFESIEPNFRALNLAAVQLIDSRVSSFDPETVKEWMRHSDAFLNGMDQIVSQYEIEARARVARLQSIELGLLGATLLVLLCEGLFIFSPAVASLRRAFLQLQNVTQQLSAAKDQAEIANRAKTTFLTRVSHELRTPLHALLGMLSLVQRRSLEPKQRERIRLSRQAARSLSTLVDDLLDIAGIELGKEPPLHNETVRLDRVLKSSAALMKGIAEKKGLAMSIEIDSALKTWIETDPHRLRQILSNLMQNAIRYTDRGSIICRARITPEPSESSGLLGGADSKSRWEFIIEDTGRGIDPIDQDRIFESFVRVESAKDSHEAFGQGLGIGLPITAGLVQALNGTIHLHSSLGVGTSVTIRFPFQPKPEPIGPSSPVRRAGKLSKTAVVVDDSSVNRRLMRAYLSRLGVRSKGIGDPEAAFAFIVRKRPDFVLLDRNLHQSDGLDLVERLRDVAADYHPKTFIVTADISLQPEMLPSDLGLAGVLHKPLEFESLALALEAFPSTPATEIDPYLALRNRLQTMVRHSLPSELETLRACLDRHDFSSLKLTAHRLFGSAANAGLQDLADSARSIESAAEIADLESCRTAVASLTSRLRTFV